MLKEKVKDIVLIMLVISSIVLTSNMWFNERLWPDGYNLFARSNINFNSIFAKVTGMFSRNTSFVKARDTLYLPNNIILNEESNLLYYGAGEQKFTEIFNDLEPIIKEFFMAADIKNAKTITISEWEDALGSFSFYINYKNSFDTKIMGLIFGINDTQIAGQIAETKEFILIPGDNVNNSILVMIKDSKTDEIYKYSINTNKQVLSDIIAKYAKEQPFMSYQYAFGLGLDKGDARGIVQFNPMLVFELFGSESSSVVNEKTEKVVNNQAEKEKILKIFEINPGTMREYVESDGSVVCVETFATVRFNVDGSIEYTAAQGYNGINLISDGILAPSYVDYINSATDFLDSTREELNDKGSMRLTSDLSPSSSTTSIDMTFDYFIGGKPVVLMWNDGTVIDNAVRLTVTNGYLKSYKHYPKYYVETDRKVQNKDMINAVDDLFAKSGSENEKVYIEDMVLAYADNGKEGEILPKWYAKVKGKEGFISK